MSMFKELKEEISKPIQLPSITIPPIQMPMIQQPATMPHNPDWIDGFLISTGHSLRAFPKEIAEDVIDDVNDILKETRKRLRPNNQ